MSHWIILAFGAVALAGCQMENPAFGDRSTDTGTGATAADETTAGPGDASSSGTDPSGSGSDSDGSSSTTSPATTTSDATSSTSDPGTTTDATTGNDCPSPCDGPSDSHCNDAKTLKACVDGCFMLQMCEGDATYCEKNNGDSQCVENSECAAILEGYNTVLDDPENKFCQEPGMCHVIQGPCFLGECYYALNDAGVTELLQGFGDDWNGNGCFAEDCNCGEPPAEVTCVEMKCTFTP